MMKAVIRESTVDIGRKKKSVLGTRKEWRLYRERDEAVAHLVCERKFLAQTQHRKRCHDKVSQVIHWRA